MVFSVPNSYLANSASCCVLSAYPSRNFGPSRGVGKHMHMIARRVGLWIVLLTLLGSIVATGPLGFHGPVLEIATVVLLILGLVVVISPEAGRIDRDLLAGPSIEQDSPREEQFRAWERRRTRTRVKLSLLPHVPIILISGLMILVVVEMVVSTRTWPSRGFYVSITSPSTLPPTTNTETAVVVQVQRRAKSDYKSPPLFRIQGDVVAPEELRDALKRELGRCSPWVVYIYGDDDLPFADIAYVVEFVNGLGARPVLVGRSRPGKE